MRRAFITLVVILLFAVGSSTALGATERITIRALVAQAGWETFDDETGGGEFGDVQFATADGRTTVFLSMSKGELVLCEGGDTPDDPFDDFYGFVGTSTIGEGAAKLTVGKSFSSARAWGTVSAEVFTQNECTGDEGTSTTKTIKVSLALDGVSPIAHEKLHSTISIPSRLRTKIVVRADSRQAAGTVKVGTRTLDAGGIIGQLALRASLSER